MRKIGLVIILFLALAGCTVAPLEEAPRPGSIRAGFAVGQSSRVSVDAALGELDWEDGDKLCMWARNPDGFEFQAQTFSLLTRIENRDFAYFTTDLDSPMPEGRYKYFGVYPMPDAVSGTTVSFDVPAAQQSGSTPVILYGSTEWGPLTAIDESSPVRPEEMMNLHMGALLHYFRFFIPEGTDILGEPVTSIRFSMPSGVAGTLSFELGADAVPAVSSALLSGGSSEVTLTGISLSEGSGEYALAAIVPPAAAYGPGDEMTVTLYGENRYATATPLVLSGRDFPSGHITAVALRENALYERYRLRFSLDGNNLGEDARKVTLTLKDGSLWPGTESSSVEWTGDQYIGIGENLTLEILEQADFLALNGKRVEVSYESDNAIITRDLTLSIAESDNLSVCSLTVPYLFEEDFSGADTGFNINGDLNSSGHSGDTIEGSAYGLPGWTANQSAVIQGSSNKALAIRHQNETVLGFQGTYRGRADAPPFTALKEGANVQVTVSFDYGGYANGNPAPQISYGYGVTQGALSGYYQGGSGAIKGGDLLENIVGDKISTPKDGSVDNVNNGVSFTISSCTPLTRLGWDCSAPKGRNSYTQEWVFIDNIKVQITK